MDPQCLRAKAGFTDTVSALAAREIYTICLHTKQHSAVFSSLNIQKSPFWFQLVDAYLCWSLTAGHYWSVDHSGRFP